MDTTPVPLVGYKYLDRVLPLLARLRTDGCDRDRAGNRELTYDRYAALLLLYFFTPAVTSLRGLQQATALAKVQAATGGGRVSLGGLSEAARVFDPAALRAVLREVAGRARPHAPAADRAALGDLVAVDGTLLAALPGMAWAAWRDGHRAAKVHVALEVFRGPADAVVTAGAGSERAALRDHLVGPGKVYVVDRGYESYGLLAAIRAAGSGFVARVRDDMAFTAADDRPVPPAAAAAGVVRDVVVGRLGTAHHADRYGGQPARVVVVAAAGRSPVTLVTDRMDWPAEAVAAAYRYRWSVELFFRWLKCILGCRHLLSQAAGGVAIQVYCALIASVLLGVWAGRKPDKRTFEMFCHFFAGLASEAELDGWLRRAQATAESSA